MSADQVERELTRLRINEDGTIGLRASVLNLIVVTDEESASSIIHVISDLSGRHPSRAIVIISDPDEEEANLEIGLSAFCGVRHGMPGGSANQICAEQITLHVEGPPAEHLESFAGPLLISDLPVFLWYPNGEIPHSPESDGMVALADRLILDSGAAGNCETFLSEVANHFGEGIPAVGDLQWTALTPWRSLVADLFAPPERARELARIRQVEILHKPEGECRALLFAGWLASALGWRPESSERTERGRVFGFVGTSGEVTVTLSPDSPDARLRRVRLSSDEYSFQVSRQRELSAVCSTVMRGDELCAERTVRLGAFDRSVLVGEELHYRGRDRVYEATLHTVVEMLDL
jgi:glucose-6-phosphate dehydrogenase assembly protein OpcA